ncbi:alpha/beta hydrolase family protein [Asticcacaulis solisilvae]|uniref:alpha/beta hydrolase family protein n=1 Tax=Asticcacaulis solisilvae TaxID=1217274 RepID=UPI003FD75512
MTAQAQTPAPQSPPPPLSAFGKLPAVDQVALSPDGNHIAMILQKATGPVIVDFDVKAGTPKVQPLGDVKIRDLMWADNEHLVVETSLTTEIEYYTNTRSELFTAFIYTPRTGKSVSLYNAWPDYFPVISGGVSLITRQGKAYVVAPGVIRAHYFLNLNAFDASNGQAMPLDQGDDNTDGWIFDNQGKMVARSEYQQDKNLWSLQLPSPSWKTAFSLTNSIDTPSLEGLGRTANTALLYYPVGEKAQRYFEVAPDGSQTELKFDPEDRMSTLHNPQTHTLAGFSYSDDWIHYDYFDPELKPLPGLVEHAFPGYRTRISAIARDDLKKTVVYSEGSDDSGTYTYIDFGSGQTLQVGQAYPDVPPEWITEKKPIEYKAADGTVIHGYLTLPPGKAAKNLPLIVLPHGGPEARDDLGYQWDVNAYASRGYAVLQPNFRGSSGYGRAFVTAGYGQWGKTMETDLSDGVRFLASQGTIDSKRVCIVGYSYGGYAALAGPTLDPGVYRCAVSYAGISDIADMVSAVGQKGASQENQTVLYWKRYLGDPANWADASPIRHIDRVTVPILLIHGKDDTTVPYQQSKSMADALKAAGKPVEFVTLKGEDHWLSTGETRLQMLTATMDFLLKNNPPD